MSYRDAQDEIFFRVNADGNAMILYATDGEPVTRLNADVWPVGSELGARYEHPNGIVLTIEDAQRLGIESE